VKKSIILLVLMGMSQSLAVDTLKSNPFQTETDSLPLVKKPIEVSPKNYAATMWKLLDSGIEIKNVASGAGRFAQKGDLVELHYIGRVQGQSEFDNSRKRGQSFAFILGSTDVLQGWNLGLIGAKTGDITHLRLPPSLGYGDRDLGIIPANSTLEYEIEILAIEKGVKPDSFPDVKGLEWESVIGLERSVIKKGKGLQVKSGQKVKVHYSGWLLGGSLFASSKLKGLPVSFTLGSGEVISGWEKGLRGLYVGSHVYLKIPPHLAYGVQAQPRIPAHATLLFKIEILEIEESLQSGDFFPELSQITWTKEQSGLEWSSIQAGDGELVPKGAKVQVHYTGWLEDGTRFDSSRLRGQTFAFTLGQGRVIRGWDEAVASMKVGDKRFIRVPSHLAYGPNGAGSIPPNATLIFAVEVLEVD
jgi:peptidylprolyl isomerase